MAYESVLKDGKERFEKTLAHLEDQLRRIRTGRASTALVDNIRVDYYGTQTPISQLASVSIPEPRQILIKPFDASILKELTRAVAQADLGSAPQDDGKVLRLVLPPLSGEQRKKYSHKVKEMCEESRIALRNTRRDLNKHSDAMQKSGELTEDDNKKLHEEIQKLLKTYEGRVDEILKGKVKEIEEV
ncbi:MAG TPA: ribosome recycling factor [Planctomycetes bacterium]|nr:ribosome recycling factor [Planctomycetota bacterium]